MELWPLDSAAAQQTWRLASQPRCACVLFASANTNAATDAPPPALAVGCADGALVAVYPGIVQPVPLLTHVHPLRWVLLEPRGKLWAVCFLGGCCCT